MKGEFYIQTSENISVNVLVRQSFFRSGKKISGTKLPGSLTFAIVWCVDNLSL